jgi:hypothetical protein
MTKADLNKTKFRKSKGEQKALFKKGKRTDSAESSGLKSSLVRSIFGSSSSSFQEKSGKERRGNKLLAS